MLKSPNKAVLSPSAGTAIPLALHVSPKPRRYALIEFDDFLNLKIQINYGVT